MTRRAALGLFALPFGAIPPVKATVRPPRIACLDDGLAETLLMLGVRPVAIADRKVWEEWVVEPALPPEVADIGTLLEPNLEFLQQLKPDLILTTPYLDGIKPLLERVAPVTTIGIYTDNGQPYRNAVGATRKLARLVGREAEGEALIEATEASLAKVGRELAPLAAGFSTVGIDGLATVDNARLAYLEPLPAGAGGTLTESPVWNAMRFVRNRSIMRLPPVLMFGALPAAARFARVLAEAMTAHG